MEPIEWLIEDSIDLHTFPPGEIQSLVEEYLFQAISKGYKEVRIIHGRGVGVQRAMVHAILKKHEKVVAYRDAMDHGSTVVILSQV